MNKMRTMGRPDLVNVSDEKIAAFIGQAPDERAAAPASVPVPAAAASTPAGNESADDEPDGDKLPPKLRKAKTPVKLTIQGELLYDFDKTARRVGLSRAAAVGLAMRMWIDAEQQKRK